MRHIFNILIVTLLTLPLKAQTIAADENTPDGHFITTTMQPVYTTNSGSRGQISLGVAFNKAMNTFFSLNLKMENEIQNSIEKGSTLQLITNTGEVILLRNAAYTAQSEKNAGDSGAVTISYGVQYNEKELADLDKIMNERIVKIKVETSKGIIEREIKDNLFARSVHNCYLVLKKHLEEIKL